MKFYDAVFFCSEESESPKVTIRDDGSDRWPITVRINESGISYDTPCITFQMNRAHLADFKNSVIEAYEKYLNEQEVKE